MLGTKGSTESEDTNHSSSSKDASIGVASLNEKRYDADTTCKFRS